MVVFYSESTDPFMNLAIEKWLLDREDMKNRESLFFCRNSPSVIIGRFQNPWLECDLQKMAEDDILLVRRESGGGAVYHDGGNLNFTFIADKDKLVKEERTGIIVKALRSLGLNAIEGQRNDIYLDGKKISGSAGRYTSSRALHHGTLLIDADLEALERYLIAGVYNSENIKSRGTASVRSRVANIAEYDGNAGHGEITDAIVKTASDFLGSPAVTEHLEKEIMEKVGAIGEHRALLEARDWIYGRTPTFSMTINNCRFSVARGIIEGIAPEDSSTGLNRWIGRHFEDFILKSGLPC